jgi:uncharacterized membrane protein
METPHATQGTVIPKFDPKDVKENAIFAALSYVSVLSVVMLILKKDSKFVQEHAKQGVVLFFAEIIVYIVGLFPVIGWFIVAPIGNLLALIVAIIGFIKAIQGEFWEIPLIGQYRSKVNF